jgi:hypothetical protein
MTIVMSPLGGATIVVATIVVPELGESHSLRGVSMSTVFQRKFH